jgi:hypothetical protein
MFSKRAREQIPRKNFCFGAELIFCCCRSYCTDPYSPYSKRKGNRNRGGDWHEFRGWFVDVDSYRTVHTAGCLHDFRGVAISGRTLQQYGLGTDYEADFGGTVWVL